MDAAMILVLILSAGVIALLAWFEINSRRNDANERAKSNLAQSSFESVQPKSNTKNASDIHRRKAA